MPVIKWLCFLYFMGHEKKYECINLIYITLLINLSCVCAVWAAWRCAFLFLVKERHGAIIAS